MKSGNYSELHNVSCSCFKNTSKYCNVTYRIKIQSRPRCSPDRPGQRETLGKFHLFFFPISSAISFKGPNAHIDAPSPTGPRIQSCHRVQGVHGAQPKNAARVLREEDGDGKGGETEEKEKELVRVSEIRMHVCV